MLYQYFVGVGLLEKQIINFGGETMFGGRGQWKIINMLQVFFVFHCPRQESEHGQSQVWLLLERRGVQQGRGPVVRRQPPGEV